MYIGIDDTDSRSGMCTTYLIFPLIEEIWNRGLDIIGYPRLVRLNPNIPWKTRGNGAICLQVGKGFGKRIKIGEMRGESIFAYTRGKNVFEEIDLTLISSYFSLKDENTNPGVVLSPKKLPESLYWKTVRQIVSVESVEDILQKYGAKWYKFKLGRGIVGASAAIPWRKRNYTYELLAYLPKEKWSKERFVDSQSVIKMDKTTTWTFDNYDYENDYVAIKPNSKTPVLFGIRGLVPEELCLARGMIRSTPYDSWIIYLTNQATDDHIVSRKIREIEAYQSVRLRGTVSMEPRTIEGGHVIFAISDSTGEVGCTAYEPTKNFREIVRKLKVGDEVEVYGGVRREPFTVNIEKMRVLKIAKIRVKLENPRCPICGRRMESMGQGKGYRCRRCGIRVGEDAAIYGYLERNLKEDWYEVPVIARRHLAKPLKLMKLQKESL